MALKAHQKVTTDDINFRLGSVEERGILVHIASGASSDGYVEKLTTTASVSGRIVAGMLLQDTVTRGLPGNLTSLGDDTGTTSLPRNMNKNETYVSGHVRLLKKGEAVTDQVSGTILKGVAIYVSPSGQISQTQAAGAQQVGYALEDLSDTFTGFVKVFIDV